MRGCPQKLYFSAPIERSSSALSIGVLHLCIRVFVHVKKKIIAVKHGEMSNICAVASLRNSLRRGILRCTLVFLFIPAVCNNIESTFSNNFYAL